jgi:uncharacterized phage protein gp47/JayE
MPYNRPALSDLAARIGATYRARFPGADTNLRQSPDRALVAVIAGSTDEDLAYLDWQVKQLFPFSADTEYLERWAAFKNIYRKGAEQGAGTVLLSGATGNVAPAGTQMQTADGSVTVELSADAVVGVDGTVVVAADALNGAAFSNIGTGVTLTFIGTPAGYADSGTVQDAFAGGAGAETDAELRLRTAAAYAQPSFGGNLNDWQRAALAVQGVTRVYTAAATPTPGAITIWPLFDNVRDNGIPVGVDAAFRPGTGPSSGISGAGDQRLVLDAVIAQRPVCAHVFVKALATLPIDIEISDLVDDSPAVRAAIFTEYSRMLFAKASVQAVPNVDAVASGYTIYLEWISAAVALGAGVKKFNLTLPAANVVVPPGTLAIPGNVTYG